ncbi:MAG: hypothetical protein R3B97_16895 [Dehalococcoidia bacterium]|nr:hypothetical protein [Dehalococcoidia bacterium]MCB9487075.1 hypothetical protein [Thermoflexaceae bacterium]
MRLDAIDSENIGHHLLVLPKAQGFGSKTVKNVHAVICACLRQGDRWEM